MSKKVFLTIAVFCFTIALYAQSAKKYYSTGKKFLESISYQDAITNFSKAIELDPKYSKAYIDRAYSYEKLGNTANAIDDYKRAIVFEPKDKELYYNAGRLLYEIGKYDDAYDMLRQAVDKDRDYFEAIEVMVKTLLKQQKYKEGKGVAELWLDRKKSSLAYYYHAVLLDSLQSYTEAEEEYKSSKYYDSKFIPAYVGLMFVQNKLKKHDEALKIAEKGIEKDPGNKDIYYARSVIYSGKNDFVSAVNDISKVITIDQNNELLFLKRAEYYEKLAQYQNAIYDYSKVLGMNPKNIHAYYRRAWNYEQLTNFKAAAVDYEKVVSIAPYNEKAKEMIKSVMDKLFELNRESYKPEIELIIPVSNEKNEVKLPLDKSELQIRGLIKDASKIKSILINGSPAQFVPDTLNPSFSLLFRVGEGAKEFSVEATDVYDNVKKIIYTIDRTEINKPLVAITTPLESTGGEIMLDNLNPDLFVEGKITDESLIESIIIEGVSASYPLDKLNPIFSTTLNIADRNELNIRVKDVNGNETNVKYKLNRESANASLDNPMGLTWVVFVENSTYKNFAMLDGPAKDVSMMKAALANYKVNKIIHKKDLSKSEMETFFNIELRDQLRNNKVKSLVVWYSGHGKYVNQTGYWIPVDAKRDEEATYFNLNTLQSALQNSYRTLDHELVITDACESGSTFLDAMRGDSAVTCNNPIYYQNKTAQILTSAGFELASDNSEFAKNIAKQLNNSMGCGASIDGIFINLLDIAKNSKGKMQTPKFGQVVGAGHVRPSTFFFIKK